MLTNSDLKPFITDITIIRTATPNDMPINEKVEITFKKPSFFLVFKYLNAIFFSSFDINLTFLPYACEIFIPNAFSPNNDGLNDIFKPSGNVTLKSMQIYNRWGEILYENSEGEFGWDGNYQKKLVHEGYYFFIIRYTKPQNGFETPYVSKGEVYLFR